MPLFFIHAGNDYSTDSSKSLDAELARLGKPHRLKIYPPVGLTADDGHDFPLNSVAKWEPDVFASWSSTCGSEPRSPLRRYATRRWRSNTSSNKANTITYGDSRVEARR